MSCLFLHRMNCVGTILGLGAGALWGQGWSWGLEEGLPRVHPDPGLSLTALTAKWGHRGTGIRCRGASTPLCLQLRNPITGQAGAPEKPLGGQAGGDSLRVPGEVASAPLSSLGSWQILMTVGEGARAGGGQGAGPVSTCRRGQGCLGWARAPSASPTRARPVLPSDAPAPGVPEAQTG